MAVDADRFPASVNDTGVAVAQAPGRRAGKHVSFLRAWRTIVSTGRWFAQITFGASSSGSSQAGHNALTILIAESFPLTGPLG
jgi:hypothetical protein